MIQFTLPLFICGIILLNGCARIETPTEPNTVTPCQLSRPVPCNTPPITQKTTIELRVLGNALSARIRHSNSEDGLTQVVTTLPYIVQFDTLSDSMFLNLEVTPISYSSLTLFPFLTAQIFANGSLFREASSTEFFLNTVTVNGTWRR